PLPAEARPGHHVEADPLDVEPRQAPQPLLHRPGQRRFVEAHRGHGDERRGQAEKVGGRGGHDGRRRIRRHVARPWSRRIELRASLSCCSPSSRIRSTRTQLRPNSPPGNDFILVAGTATARSGTTPRDSSSPVALSMTGVEAVRTTPAPSFAPRHTRAPSTTIEREPMKASSSITTGAAWGGSSTPPTPTPPERCTPRPTWAQEPTVAHVSTMLPSPT